MAPDKQLDWQNLSLRPLAHVAHRYLLPVLNRAIPPQPAPLAYRPFPTVEKETLLGGAVLYMLPNKSLPLAEIQLVFRSGLVHEPKPGLTATTLKMLREGTQHKSAAELAYALDAQGSFLSLEPGFEVSTISLSGLSDRLPKALDLLKEVVTQPAFEPREYELLRQRSLQSLSVEEQRTSYQARKHFMAGIFGPLHPYGRTVDAEAIADLSLADLQAYHAHHLKLGNAFIILSGDFDSKELLPRLEDLLAGTFTLEAIPYAPSLHNDHSQLTGRHRIEMMGKPQSTLRSGFSIPSRLHPDFHLARFATLVLGGYFGSRLMRNLREEKGYTYGASASWGAYRHSGYFVMGADVSNEHTEPALAEMRSELERMCSEPVHPEELEVARNFWLGRLAARAETPFEAAEILRAYIANGLTLADDEMAFRAVQQATASDLLRVAQTHFKPQQLFEVVAGG